MHFWFFLLLKINIFINFILVYVIYSYTGKQCDNKKSF